MGELFSIRLFDRIMASAFVSIVNKCSSNASTESFREQLLKAIIIDPSLNLGVDAEMALLNNVLFTNPSINELTKRENVYMFRRTAFYKYHYNLFRFILHMNCRSVDSFSQLNSKYNDYKFKFVPELLYFIIRMLKSYQHS